MGICNSKTASSPPAVNSPSWILPATEVRSPHEQFQEAMDGE